MLTKKFFYVRGSQLQHTTESTDASENADSQALLSYILIGTSGVSCWNICYGEPNSSRAIHVEWYLHVLLGHVEPMPQVIWEQ